MGVLTEADRDRAAEVFAAHRQFVEAVAQAHSPHPQDVPDIVQEVAIRVCRGLNGYRGDCDIQGWLGRLTRNTAVSYWRQQRRHQRVVEAIQENPTPEAVMHPDELVVQGERRAALGEALDRMRPLYAAAIREDITGGSVVLGRNVRHRARQQLRRQLAEDPRITE